MTDFPFKGWPLVNGMLHAIIVILFLYVCYLSMAGIP